MKITFESNQYFLLNDKVNVPIPDGYHFTDSGTGENAGWFYIVPNDVPFEENHIDAKPLSFGITANKIGDFPFDVEKLEAIKQFMIANGHLDETITVYQVICSEHCCFLYQNWTNPSDATYNKINGFLFAYDELYMFHAFANHTENIAHEEKTIYAFEATAVSWMEKTYLIDEAPNKEKRRIPATAEGVSTGISTLFEIEKRLHSYIGGRPLFEEFFTDFIFAVCAMFCKTNELPVNNSSLIILKDLNYRFTEKRIKSQLNKVKYKLERYKLESNSIREFISDINGRFVVNQFVTCDKILNTDINNGVIAYFSETMEAMLEFLREKEAIDSDSFSDCFLKELRELEKEKWDSVAVFFSFDEAEKKELLSLLKNGVSTSEKEEKPATKNEKREEKKKEPAARRKKEAPNTVDSFEKIGEKISIGKENPSLFLVNNEWTFILPKGFEYFTDCEFDGFVDGGVSLNGSVKPLVIKGLKRQSDYLFNFALEDHYDFFGNYYSIIDCKYDNRMTDEESRDSKIVIVDEDDFYVDIISVNSWPLGTDLEIRVRGSKITPVDFFAMVKNTSEEDFKKIAAVMKEIASSIRLNTIGASPAKKTSAAGKKTTRNAKTSVKDPNCIIEGTVLKKYIGSGPDITLPDGLTEIADNTFSGRNIHSVIVPEGVEKIGNRVFENCFELEEIDLPSTIKYLGGYCFVDCHKLKRINLGNNLGSIESSVFSECFKLENVVIPEKTKYIDAFAFKNCQSFTSIVIPDSVTSIGFTAFAYCTNLSYLYIPASVTEICDNFMGDTPFGGCSNLTIHCPSGSYAEEYCKTHGINYVTDSSPIVQKQTSSAVSAKKNNSSKSGASTGRNQHFYSEEALAERQAKKEKKAKRDAEKASKPAEAKQEKKKVVDEGPAKMTIADGILKKYVGNEETVIVPDGVTGIGTNAFKDNVTLRKIVLPEGLLLIDDSAFNGCSNLAEINWVNTIEDIGKRAFKGCSSLETIVIPGNTINLMDNAFEDCVNLKTLVIHPDVIYRNEWANNSPFRNCFSENTTVYVKKGSNADIEWLSKDSFVSKKIRIIYDYPEEMMPKCTLSPEKKKNKQDLVLWKNTLHKYRGTDETFVIPNGVKTIDIHAFSNGYYVEKDQNTTLKHVVIPNTVSTIKFRAFEGCAALESIEIPYGIKTLQQELFHGCKNLKYVTLPDTVQKVEFYVFSDCKSLISVNFPKGLKVLDKDSFGNFTYSFDKPGNLTIYGHRGSVAESFALAKGLNFSIGLPAGIPAPRTATTPDPTEKALKEKEEIEKKKNLEREKRLAEEKRKAEEKARQEAEAKRLAEERMKKLDALNAEKQALLKIIEDNKGLFGDKAKRRKEAKQKLAAIEEQILKL